MILFIIFFVHVYQSKDEIYKIHDTISSFCADKNSWGNRFLLIFTCIVGLNMLCLHVEEYNSRPNESDVLFGFTVFCIFQLPLVGICYTRGKQVLYFDDDKIDKLPDNELNIAPTSSQVEVPRDDTALS